MTWTVSENGENFRGDFETREEAILEGQQYGNFWIGTVHEPIQPEQWWNADDWLEHVTVQDEYGGDDAEGWDDSTKEQREELEREVREVMSKWLDRHGLRPRFFNVKDIEEIKSSDIASE